MIESAPYGSTCPSDVKCVARWPEVLLHVGPHVPMVAGIDIVVKGPHATKGDKGKPRSLG